MVGGCIIKPSHSALRGEREIHRGLRSCEKVRGDGWWVKPPRDLVFQVTRTRANGRTLTTTRRVEVNRVRSGGWGGQTLTWRARITVSH